MMTNKIDLSVIITVSSMQKRDDVQSLFTVYKNRIEEAGLISEFIYVTDDESDNLLGELQKLQNKGENIKIVKLSKWFGDASALNIAFEEASGRLILTLPASQQISDKEISRIIRSFNNSDMVIANRARKKDNVFLRAQAKIFHFLVNMFIGMHYHDLGCRVRLFKGKFSNIFMFTEIR